jgi:hypothetical protein
METLRCKSCSVELQSNDALKAHVLEAHGFLCKTCNIKFVSDYALKNHRLNTHSKEFKCTWKGNGLYILVLSKTRSRRNGNV